VKSCALEREPGNSLTGQGPVSHRPVPAGWILGAYIEAGSVAGAAWRLEIAESTARHHLSAL
jgi:hypothetical protein